VGSSPELKESIRKSIERHKGDITAVTRELQVPREMVELLRKEGDD